MKEELSSLTFILSLFALAARAQCYWCVARSGASDAALLAGLNYACSAGADCGPIHAGGLCFLPNTLQAHASYAFNSLYQRKSMAPGSCDFSGTAMVSKTDPSYGSCVYPPNPSAAGLLNNTTTPTPAISGGGYISTTTNAATAAASSWLPTASFVSFTLLSLAAQ